MAKSFAAFFLASFSFAFFSLLAASSTYYFTRASSLAFFFSASSFAFSAARLSISYFQAFGYGSIFLTAINALTSSSVTFALFS